MEEYCSSVIIGILLWVPIKMVSFCLRVMPPDEAAMENLGNLTNQAIDDYFKQNPL